MKSSNKLISIVVPVFNEESNILPLFDALKPIMESLKTKYDFEVIFTDNHSIDATFSILSDLVLTHSFIRVYRFSKNFGYQKSILTGYIKSRGDAVIQLDCDLQDPPALMVNFLEKWEAGCDVVYGIRLTRTNESKVIHLLRKLFYRAVNSLSDDHLPLDAGDFRLVDKKIIDLLRQVNDANPYLRGLIASMGFRQEGVPYHRSQRDRGTSKFSIGALFSLAVDGILNHSIIPLRAASFFGIVVSIATIVGILSYLAGRIFFGVSWPAGFTTLTILLLFGIGINALFLGIIGEYLGRIYQQVKARPQVIIETSLGPKS